MIEVFILNVVYAGDTEYVESSNKTQNLFVSTPSLLSWYPYK